MADGAVTGARRAANTSATAAATEDYWTDRSTGHDRIGGGRVVVVVVCFVFVVVVRPACACDVRRSLVPRSSDDSSLVRVRVESFVVFSYFYSIFPKMIFHCRFYYYSVRLFVCARCCFDVECFFFYKRREATECASGVLLAYVSACFVVGVR